MNKLSEMKKGHPFKVPDNYFENLSEKVNERIEAEESSKKSKIAQVLKPYIWMAASIIGVVLIARLILTTSVDPDYNTQQITLLDSSYSDTSIINQKLNDTDDLFMNDISDVSINELVEYLLDSDIETETLLANL